MSEKRALVEMALELTTVVLNTNGAQDVEPAALYKSLFAAVLESYEAETRLRAKLGEPSANIPLPDLEASGLGAGAEAA